MNVPFAAELAGAIVTGLVTALVLAFTIRHEYRLARLARVDDATGRLHAAASTIQMLLITRRTFTTDGHDTFAAFNRAAFEVIARARSTHPVLAQACEELVKRINHQLAELDARRSQLKNDEAQPALVSLNALIGVLGRFMSKPRRFRRRQPPIDLEELLRRAADHE